MGEGDFADAIFILEFLFGGALEKPTCIEACNVNGDFVNNIADAIYLLVHLFGGGPPPLAPFPDCGGDPRGDDSLGCGSLGCD